MFKELIYGIKRRGRKKTLCIALRKSGMTWHSQSFSINPVCFMAENTKAMKFHLNTQSMRIAHLQWQTQILYPLLSYCKVKQREKYKYGINV